MPVAFMRLQVTHMIDWVVSLQYVIHEHYMELCCCGVSLCVKDSK